MKKENKNKNESSIGALLKSLPTSVIIPIIVTIITLYFTINSFILAQPNLFITSDKILRIDGTPHYELELQNIGKKPLTNVKIKFCFENNTDCKEQLFPYKTLPADMENPKTVIIQPDNFKNITALHIFEGPNMSFTPPPPSNNNLTVKFYIAILKNSRLFVEIYADDYRDKREFSVSYPIIFTVIMTYTEEGAKNARLGKISPINWKLLNVWQNKSGEYSYEEANIKVERLEYIKVL